MSKRIHPGIALSLTCLLLLGACKGKHTPTKPTATPAADRSAHQVALAPWKAPVKAPAG
jgi:hypothetical protein